MERLFATVEIELDVALPFDHKSMNFVIDLLRPLYGDVVKPDLTCQCKFFRFTKYLFSC